MFSTRCLASPSTDSLVAALNQAIASAPAYDEVKLSEITRLKGLLVQGPAKSTGEQFFVQNDLYEQYKYYNYDSAMFYALRLQTVAGSSANKSLLVDAKLKVVFLLLSGGMFKETFDSLNVISISGMPDSLRAEYYTLMGRAYYNLADFNSDSYHTPIYNRKANLYLDSALAIYDKTSFEYLYFSAIRFLKKNESDSARINLETLLTRQNLSYHQVALTTSTIGGIYLNDGRENDAIQYLVRASIADIKSSTKETLALITLAGIVYKNGSIEDAVGYIEKANTDAGFYNARLRKVQVGNILPLIEGKMIETIKSQKQKLVIFLTLLSFLVILLACFAIVIRNQVKKLKLARAGLYEANQKQQQVNAELVKANELKALYNDQLQQINNQLSEANKIKEEYIGYFFSIDTDFLARIEKLVSSIERKLVDRKYSEIQFMLKGIEMKKEKEALLKNFDRVFVKLFPDFVAGFNSLFQEEDRVILKEDQLLNTELRIFALIRLGINDNEKIAEILDYSINTIYAKKTKLRSRTIVNKDDFEKKLIEITTLKKADTQISEV